MYQNPVTRPITETLIVRTNGKTEGVLGFLTKEGILDADGILTPVRPGEKICIAHPYDLYAAGCWQDYQKLLFEQKIKQPFKQAFRELYLKLEAAAGLQIMKTGSRKSTIKKILSPAFMQWRTGLRQAT